MKYELFLHHNGEDNFRNHEPYFLWRFNPASTPTIVGFIMIHPRYQILESLDVSFQKNTQKKTIILWLFNIAIENGPSIVDLPIKNGGSFHGYVK